MVADFTSKYSLDNIRKWHAEAKKDAEGKGKPRILLITKSDYSEKISYDERDIHNLVVELQLDGVVCTSAKNNVNISDAFEMAVSLVNPQFYPSDHSSEAQHLLPQVKKTPITAAKENETDKCFARSLALANNTSQEMYSAVTRLKDSLSRHADALKSPLDKEKFIKTQVLPRADKTEELLISLTRRPLPRESTEEQKKQQLSDIKKYENEAKTSPLNRRCFASVLGGVIGAAVGLVTGVVGGAIIGGIVGLPTGPGAAVTAILGALAVGSKAAIAGAAIGSTLGASLVAGITLFAKRNKVGDDEVEKIAKIAKTQIKSVDEDEPLVIHRV